MNSHIQTVTRTVRAGRVQFFNSIYEAPAALHAALEGQDVHVDYHVHDLSGVRLRSAVGITCWASLAVTLDPFSPASGATDRQSRTDGPSGPAPSGGHQGLLHGSGDYIQGRLLAMTMAIEALLLAPYLPARAAMPDAKQPPNFSDETLAQARQRRVTATLERREAQMNQALAELGEPDGSGVNFFPDEVIAEARRFRVPARKRETGSAPAAPAEIPPGHAVDGPSSESPTAVDTQAPHPCDPGCSSTPATLPLPPSACPACGRALPPVPPPAPQTESRKDLGLKPIPINQP